MSLRLNKVYLSGINNFEDIRLQVCESFMEDDQFFWTQAFKEYVWRAMNGEYATLVQTRRSESLEKPQEVVVAKVQDELRAKYSNIFAEEGRALVRKSGVLLLPEWDLASAIAFDTVRRQDTSHIGFTGVNF